MKKAFVTRNFRFSRPGAAAEVLIADFGLKHPVPLELYVGDKVTVLEQGVGKNGKWTLGHLGNITGVFPTVCIKGKFNNNNSKNKNNNNNGPNMNEKSIGINPRVNIKKMKNDDNVTSTKKRTTIIKLKKIKKNYSP